MKVAMLNYRGCYVEVADIPEEYENLDGEDMLSRMGYDLDDTHFMCVDGDIPVFVNGEDAPTITL